MSLRFTIESPLFIARPKAKNFILNLNVYRNTHYQTLNNMKVAYKKLMEPAIVGLPCLGKINLTYVLYPKTRRLTDVSNVCSVHDKFFCDALVEEGKMDDDNYLYIPEITYRFGYVDKNNPRVDIIIEVINEHN